MLSDERIRQFVDDIFCSECSPPEIEHSIRAALAEAAQVPVMGDAVAWPQELRDCASALVKLFDRDCRVVDRVLELPCETHGQAWNHMVQAREIADAARMFLSRNPEQQPILSTTITQAELDAKDARIRELEKALVEIRDWTARYTSPGHPITTTADKAIAKERQL